MMNPSAKKLGTRWALAPVLLLGCGLGSATGTEPDTTDGPLANECQNPGEGWIWCDDFDEDRSGAYFEYVSRGGSFERVAEVGTDGSAGMRARFSAGQVDAGALHLAMGRTPSPYFRPADAGTEDYREIFWRVYLRHQAGWVGGSGEKLSRVMVFASGSWAEAMVSHVWGADRDYLYIDPARGTDEAGTLLTTQYNDFPHFTWLGGGRGRTPIFDSAHVGQWYCIESQVRLNDPGAANGEARLWIDGEMEVEVRGLNFLGGYDAYGINGVFLENFWNDGSPVSQERYFDNFVVSTQPIGCPQPAQD
jgi:hypothetical protein